MSTEVTAERVLSLLSAGTLTLEGLLPGASNDTFLCTISDGELDTYAVYKPRAGEAPLWDFPDGTLYLREMAAYVFAQALGWDLVPPTVIRDGPRGIGMVQLFIDHDPAEHYLTLADGHDDVFRRVAAFDLAINNADRKSGHCLLQRETRRLFVVDHGVTFHRQPKLRTVIWDFAGERLPDDVRGDLERFVSANGSAALAGLLDGAEIESLDARIAALLSMGVFPEPGPGRPYPWPPI